MKELDLDAIPGRKARIEIIPLIDVVFFLLATFVLFTLSLDKIGALTVPLPKGGEDPAYTTLFLQASDHGMYYWKVGRDGPSELVAAAELASRLEQYKRSVPQPRVLVRGDRTAKFSAAVRALDEVRQAGITQVSLETLVTPAGS